MSVDPHTALLYGSCMSKNVTLDDEAYDLLKSLKIGPQDSFSQVVRRNIHRPANTCGELLDLEKKLPPLSVDLDKLDRMEKERGRRSGGRK